MRHVTHFFMASFRFLLISSVACLCVSFGSSVVVMTGKRVPFVCVACRVLFLFVAFVWASDSEFLQSASISLLGAEVLPSLLCHNFLEVFAFLSGAVAARLKP